MQNTFTEIYAIVRRIPVGMAASYGTIARLAGNPCLSRVVGYAMRACNDEAVPCHRVVHKDGRLAEVFGLMGNGLQRTLLAQEGAQFCSDGRVDMERCGWRG